VKEEELGANQSGGRPAAHRAWSWWLVRSNVRPRPRPLLPAMEPAAPLLARPPALEGPPSQEPAQSPMPAEEPEYLARYSVTKHSWRGKYKRILCLSPTQIITLEPTTLQTTNVYDVSTDYESAAPVTGGRDDPLQHHALEFTINLRTEGRGKFKSIKFSSRYRAAILTELLKLKPSSSLGPSPTLSLLSAVEFPVLHLRRRVSDWTPFVCVILFPCSLFLMNRLATDRLSSNEYLW
jgi:hypothetical protein